MIRIPSADTLAVITGRTWSPHPGSRWTTDDREADIASFVVPSIIDTHSMRDLCSASTMFVLCVNVGPG